MRKSATLAALLLSGALGASTGQRPTPPPDAGPGGRYHVRLDQPRQVIWGLGVEIQNDAIGSGNSGMPNEVIAVPHDLVPAERQRFYHDLLRGFRYCRLAMGLYFRGLDAEQKHIVERYPHQLNDLKEMMRESGMEGLSMEYWSCAPHWKSTGSYLGGTLKSTEPAFLDEFGDALVKDVKYLTKGGLKISMWGLQNEPGVGQVGSFAIGNAPKQSYSHCHYPPEMYYQAFKAVAPKIRRAAPQALLMVDSWDGNRGSYGRRIQQDAQLLPLVDAWVYHRIGSNSNQIMAEGPAYNSGTFGKPVFQNEFEYQHPTSDSLCLNTAQNILNWFVFADSPTWFWLHALKPAANAEASGYSLGFWRPAADRDTSRLAHIKPGHWDYNPQNFNAVAGFLKHLPWNSRRYHVAEDTLRRDQRIMAYRTPRGQLGLALTNRSRRPFTFRIATGGRGRFRGHRYTPAARNLPAGRQTGPELTATLPPLSIEFWQQE